MQERCRGGTQLVLLHQPLLVVVNRSDVMNVRLLHLSAPSSLRDSLKRVGALRAEGGG